ncbi:MAG: hypothetical protein M3347_09645 [Armatimonadota bacterium]|nr:hypothetical protein [Armatimonadota bacterium]
MKKTYLNPFLFIVFLVSLGTGLAWAANTWLFTDEAQMRQEIPKHVKNSRALYYIIVRSRNRDLGGQTALALRDLLQKSPNNPHLEIAYAFSLFMARDQFHRERYGQKRFPVMTEVERRAGDISYYQRKALKALPKSPSVLLMAARSDFYTYISTSDDSIEDERKAINLVRRAIKEDPQWGDLYYWLGRMLIDQNTNHRNKVDKARNAHEAIAALQKVEKLKPSWRADCLRQYISAYRDLGQIGKTLEYLDAYGKERPGFAKQPWVIQWRQSLMKQLQEKRS